MLLVAPIMFFIKKLLTYTQNLKEIADYIEMLIKQKIPKTWVVDVMLPKHLEKRTRGLK